MRLTALAAAGALLCAPAFAEPGSNSYLRDEGAAAIAQALSALEAATFERAGVWSVADMNEQIDQTNFIVNEGCSGTLIDLEKRYVLTANHCIENQYETITREKVADDGTVSEEKIRRLKPGVVRQLSYDGPFQVVEVTYRTKMVATDKDDDLAVVEILADIPNTEAAPISCTFPTRGEPVFIVGNPMGNLYSSVVTGIVSSVQRSYDMVLMGTPDDALMQISGGIVGGNSGGAVYNASGELIGVPVLSHRANEVLGFAVPLDVIHDFLSEKKLVEFNCEAE